MIALDTRPLIAHVVYRFDIGGLENGVVNLLNGLPEDRFRHAVVSLTDVTDFRHRVRRSDVEFFEMHKPPGHAVKVFPGLLRVFRKLKPTIVHTRNLAALEAILPAWLVHVPVRIHGEHGRDVGDLDGSNRRYRVVRRMYRPFVTQYVAVSEELEGYLVDGIGVSARIVDRIVNGVDTAAFRPAASRMSLPGSPFTEQNLWICGTVGRLQSVKNQTLLARAFVRALAMRPDLRKTLRLVIVGEGPLRAEIEHVLVAGNAHELAWLPGTRSDVADVLRTLDVFVLPSRAEGVSNTILEAMASGLPVIATAVGGNSELLARDTGILVPPDNVEALATMLVTYATDREVARCAGRAGRLRAERVFGLDSMIGRYASLYERLIQGRFAAGGQGRRSPVARTTIGSN